MGVESLKDFDFEKQVKAVRVGFIPEYSRAQNGKVVKRTIVPKDVEWIEMKGKVK